MRKHFVTILVIGSAALFVSGCQAISSGLVKKASCCDKLLPSCNTPVIKTSTEVKESTEASSGASIDLLKGFPFSTIVQ